MHKAKHVHNAWNTMFILVCSFSQTVSLEANVYAVSMNRKETQQTYTFIRFAINQFSKWFLEISISKKSESVSMRKL